MKAANYEEEGVATAVGTIFAILIFIFLLSLFVTSYVPAEMTSLEEQYTSNVLNGMMELISTINLLTLDHQAGQSASVTFYFSSNYVPLFSSPTIGSLTLSRSSQNQYGTIYVNNSTIHLFSGGTLSAITNDRYFVDESFVYQFSSLFYEQYGSNPLVNTSLQYGLIHVTGPSGNGTKLDMTLVNLVGGPITLSTQSPFIITVQILSEEEHFLNGSVTLTIQSPLALTLYNATQTALFHYPAVALNKVFQGADGIEMGITSSNQSSPLSLEVTEVTVLLGVNSSTQ